MKNVRAYQEFIKDPIKYVTFLLLTVVSFLYFRNEQLHKERYKTYEKNIAELKIEIKELKEENKAYAMQLKKSDSALAAISAKLEMITSIKSSK